MEKIRVLHCADLHLGSELAAVPERARERRQELLRTFRNIVERCQQQQIDILIIAGDLFEGSNVDAATVQSVKSYLGELEHTIIAIAPGNHDYLSIDSPYAESDWPANTVVFHGEPQCLDFPERGFALYGAAFSGTYVQEPLLTKFPPVDPDRINIGVLHGDLVSAGSSSSYNPVTESQIAASRLDYLALGHIHKRTPVLQAGQTSFAYSGCPDGRGFDELGEKGIYMGTVGRHQTDLHFQPTCSRMYLTEEIDITGVRTEPELVRQTIARLNERHGKQFSSHYYKIRLTGTIAADAVLSIDSLEDHLRDHLYFAKVRDATRIEANYEELAAESSLKGIFVRRMLERIGETKQRDGADHADNLLRALDLGLRAFDGEVMRCED